MTPIPRSLRTLALVVTILVAYGWLLFIPAVAAPRPHDDSQKRGDPPFLTFDQFSVLGGMPRSWQAGVAVSPYSVVNLANGNVCTAIHLTGWDPVGPPIDFTLYHNSIIGGDEVAPTGLIVTGTGWSTTYSGTIIPTLTGAYVFEDDGTINFFAEDEGNYLPPPGVHDRLAWDDKNSKWTLTRVNQSKRIYDEYGTLTDVVDAAGNAVTIVRDGATWYVYDASGVSGNKLTLKFSTCGRLAEVNDPRGRKWILGYYANEKPSENIVLGQIGFFCSRGGFDDPCEPTSACADSILITYDVADRISSLTDRDGLMTTYTYNPFTLSEARSYSTDKKDPYFTQLFEYCTVINPGDPGKTKCDSQPLLGQAADWTWTFYTDRRGKEWKYLFDEFGNLRGTVDPLGHTQKFVVDGDRNTTEYHNQYDNVWTMTYGPIGNLETIETPLKHTTTYSWTADDDKDPLCNFYRLTQVTDADGHWVSMAYESKVDPTAVTSITEMADGQGNGPAVTTLAYYDGKEDGSLGQLESVTDANGVQTRFAYTSRGYLAGFTEGPEPIQKRGTIYVEQDLEYDSQPTGIPTTWYCGTGSNPSITTGALGDTIAKGTCGTDEGRTIYGPPRLGTTPSPRLWAEAPECYFGLIADNLHRPIYSHHCSIGTERYHSFYYDSRWRLESEVVDTSDLSPSTPIGSVTRTSLYTDYDENGNLLAWYDADNNLTEYTYDDLGRLDSITRGDDVTTFTYYDHGLLHNVFNSNGTYTLYTYDADNRLTAVAHRGDGNKTIHTTTYAWNDNGTLATRTDYEASSAPTSITEYTYDNRDRLIQECRSAIEKKRGASVEYDLSYTYDQLGNRLTKTDNLSGKLTQYHYDITDPEPGYETRNNRLIKYEEYIPEETVARASRPGGASNEPRASASGIPGTPAERSERGEPKMLLTRTVHYTYYQTGHAGNITIKDEAPDGAKNPGDYDWYRDVALYYHNNGQLRLALWDRWKVSEKRGEDGERGEPTFTNYTKEAAREFHYEGGRGRWLTRAVDPDTLLDGGTPQIPEPLADGGEWTEYVGGSPVADLSLGEYGDTLDRTRTYVPGTGIEIDETIEKKQRGKEELPGHLQRHSDMIGTTVATSDGEGADSNAATRPVYTAFGELVSGVPGDGSRYGYAGDHGYEADSVILTGAPGTASITLMHVGMRHYQPDVGRFIQRDPTGLIGGLNVYEYAHSCPMFVDPDGLTLGEWLYDNVPAFRSFTDALHSALDKIPGMGRLIDSIDPEQAEAFAFGVSLGAALAAAGISGLGVNAAKSLIRKFLAGSLAYGALRGLGIIPTNRLTSFTDGFCFGVFLPGAFRTIFPGIPINRGGLGLTPWEALKNTRGIVRR